MKTVVSTLLGIVTTLGLLVTSGVQPTVAQSQDTTNTQWQAIKKMDTEEDNQTKLSQAPSPSAQGTDICKPSSCTPTAVLFLNDLLHGNTTSISGCIAYVDVTEDHLLGGNIRSTSLIQPLRDVPVIGEAIDAAQVIKAEKWAAAIVAAVDGEQSYLDAAWVIVSDLGTDAAAGAILNKALKSSGLSFPKSLAEALKNTVIAPVLSEIADLVKNNPSDWIKYYQTVQAWPYGNLEHCIDTGKLACYPNYKSFLQEYPETFKYLDKPQVLYCNANAPSKIISNVIIPSAVIIATGLNVRFGPGITYNSIGVVQRNDVFAIIGQVQDCSWLQVNTPLGQGWISGLGKYVTLNLPCDSIPVVSVSPTPIQPLLEQPTVVHSPTPLPPAPASTPAPPAAQPPTEIPISFTAERTTITAGECTNLRWDVDNVRAVYFDNLGVTGHETHKVCPAATQTFHLVVVYPGNRKVEQTVTIQVTSSSSAPAAPPISFSADRTTLNPGECAILRWDVDNVNEVHLDEEGVVGHDTRKVCPDSTETYKLTVVRRDGTEEKRTVTIQVNVPASAPGGPHGPSQPQEGNFLCGQLVKTSGGLDQWFFPSSGNPPLLKLGYSQPTTPPGLTDGAYYRVRDPQIVQSGEGCDPNFGCTTTYLLIIVDDNPYDNWEAVSSCN